jgi:hypothetical protein
MKMTEFDNAIDATENDPKAKVKRCARNLVEQNLGRHGLNPEQIERFPGPALRVLYDGAKVPSREETSPRAIN